MKAIARLVTVTALALSAVGAWAADANKVLHLAFPDISGLDPQQIGDLSSVRIAQQIFEGLYEYSYLADPVGGEFVVKRQSGSETDPRQCCRQA